MKVSKPNTMWTNYHSHSHYCDGKYEPEKHILSAIKKGFLAFGYSSHGPLPFETNWNIKLDKLPVYLAEIHALKKIYASQIEIYTGLEVDFIPGIVGPSSDFIQATNLDYSIGSIHMVDAFENGYPWEIDGPHQLFLKGLTQIFKGEVRKAVRRYFELTREMLENDPPTILGHMDKIKIQSENGVLFSENDTWYKAEVMKTLETIAGKSVIVEVNTRGLHKKLWDEPYPSYWILKEMHKMNIPIMLNSDSHAPHEIAVYFQEVTERLADIGFKKLKVLLANEWQEREILMLST